MTLSSTTTKTTYSGDGATTQFATGFKFLKNSHVKVILRDENASPVTETTWVEGTHYTLTGAGDAAGGTVTVKTTPTDYTPQTGEKLIVKRNAPETQGTALPAGGAFPSGSVEEMVDHATMLAQQHSEELARVLSFAETSPTSAVAMPEPNGNDVIGWDGSGGLTNYDSSTFSGPQGPQGPAGDMTNPMTARGDIIAGDAAGPGDPQRLGLGAANTVLKSDGTDPSWGATIHNVVEDTTPQLGGALDGQDNTVSKVNLKDYGEVTQALSGTGNKTIDLTAGNSVTHTAFGAVTWTFSNPPAAPALGGVTISAITWGIGAQTFPANTKFVGGTAPTFAHNTATFTTDYATDDKLDITAHGFNNGERVHVTSSTTLPAGLSADTIYFVINKTANDFELSTTLGGSAVDITDDGTGTHTLHSGEDKVVIETDNGGSYYTLALAEADVI